MRPVYAWIMSPDLVNGAVVRPAAAVNSAIRAIVVRAQGRPWTTAERALYGLLLDEWERAVREEEPAAA